MTRSVNAAIFDLIQEGLKKKFGLRCLVSDQWVTEPLSEKDRRLYINAASAFVFVADFDRKTEEVHLSLFSPDSGMRWAHTARRLGDDSAVGSRALVDDLVEGMMSQFPYVGVWDSKTLIIWASLDDFNAIPVQKVESKSHPFLPEESLSSKDAASNKAFRVFKNGDLWSLRSFDGKAASLPKARVWLRAAQD